MRRRIVSESLCEWRRRTRPRAAWFNRKTGAGAVKLAEMRDPAQRRVIVKAKFVVHANAGGRGGAASLMRHALYVERDGAGRSGEGVCVFDAERDAADASAFVERCEADRHHFRFIISPEDGAEIPDLRSYTRDLMRRVETDLKTRLDWVAAEHHDTGRPHVHLLMRGVRDDGRDLVIPREYVSHGFRHRAAELATEILGPRLEHELDRRVDRLPNEERFTSLDRALIECAKSCEIALADLPDEPLLRARLARRLTRLEEWGLAKRDGPGVWRLDGRLEDRLIQLGDARDHERTLARILAQHDRGLEPERSRTLENAHSSQRVVGKLLGFEPITTDPRGPTLIAVEGIDGRLWSARIARVEDLRAIDGAERGAIVSLTPARAEIRPADRTIWEIAQKNSLSYSAELHWETFPRDRDEYVRAHERRLEALRREGLVERRSNGAFHLPSDYCERVAAHEGRGGRGAAEVRILDPQGLEKQVARDGPTWIDRVVFGPESSNQIAQTGFGAEVRAIWEKRMLHLKELGLAFEHQGSWASRVGWREELREMERDELRRKIERDTGRVPHFASPGENVQGLFAGKLHAAERTYALVLQERTATLVPWRPEMDRALNHFVSGRVNDRGFDFKYGKQAEKALKLGRGLGIDL